MFFQCDYCVLSDQPGWSALHAAVYEENEQLVEMLIAAGADVNIEDSVSGELSYVLRCYVRKCLSIDWSVVCNTTG